MAQIDWRLEGAWMKNCICAYGCPCDFNARPTNGECKGIVGMRIDSGYFDDTRLDGLCFFASARWPGPLHEGNGELQPFIDSRASPDQRDALLQIMSGKHSAEGTLFHILSMVVSKVHDPIAADMEFELDKEARTARARVADFINTTVEPMKNPVTGAPHRVQLVMPEGFEHIEAEVASATISCQGEIPINASGTHSSLAFVVQTPQGVAA